MTRSTPDLAHVDELIRRLVSAVRRPAFHLRALEGIPNVKGAGALRVLRSVEAHQQRVGQASIRDVAVDLEIEQSSASRAVNALIDRGLVARRSASDDQRRAQLTLTEAGQTALDRATINRKSVLQEVTAGWSPADLATLEVLFERLVAAYENVDPPRNA